jgi:addiction module HigA family antidote
MKEIVSMVNPPHPGEFISEVYLQPLGISGRELAGKLGVTASTLQRLIKGSHGVSPEMALRLSIVVGRSAESWLAMQDAYDLWQARLVVDVTNLEPLALDQAAS